MSPEALAVCIGDNILATHALRTMTEHEFAKYCEQQGVLNVIKKTWVAPITDGISYAYATLLVNEIADA